MFLNPTTFFMLCATVVKICTSGLDDPTRVRDMT